MLLTRFCCYKCNNCIIKLLTLLTADTKNPQLSYLNLLLQLFFLTISNYAKTSCSDHFNTKFSVENVPKFIQFTIMCDKEEHQTSHLKSFKHKIFAIYFLQK